MTRGSHARRRVSVASIRARVAAGMGLVTRMITRYDRQTRLLIGVGAAVLACGLTATAVLGGFPGGQAATGRSVPANEAYVAPPSTGAVQIPPGGFSARPGSPAARTPPGARRGHPFARAPIAIEAVTTAAFGPVLAADGLTLYRVTPRGGSLTCGSACTPDWRPLLLASGQAVQLAPGLTGQLGTITLPDGSAQITYNGVPLYRFAADHAPGDTNGAGGRWRVVRAR